MFNYECNCGTWVSVTLLLLTIGFYWWKKRQYYKNYWKKKGVTAAPLHNLWTTLKLLLDLNLAKILMENYQKYGKLFGSFDNTVPTIHIADPELLKDILVKDFHVFNYRREMVTGDPLPDKAVSVLIGEDWKRVRTTITPAFTSKRMRLMGSIINECSKSIVEVCEKYSQKGEPVDCKGLFGSFTMDVIARAAFGTKIDSASDPDNEFLKNAKRIFPDITFFHLLMAVFAPMWMLKKFRYFSSKESIFFRDVILQIIKERKETGQRCNDVLQILMDCTNEKKLAGSQSTDFEDETDRFGSIVDSNTHSLSIKYKKLSEDELLSQCVLFFFAGYETSASTLTFLSYCLALHPDWQERVINEVDEAFSKHSEMSYDTVKDMKILDAVLSETMRMYPIFLFIERTASEEYKLGSTGIVLEKGTRVHIPIFCMHYDEDYFPDPHTFNPERFLESADSLPYVYMPFGLGPRNCLGMRFALLEIKMVMANLLRHFRIKRHDSTKVPIEFKKAFLLLSVKEMPLTLEKRTDTHKV